MYVLRSLMSIDAKYVSEIEQEMENTPRKYMHPIKLYPRDKAFMKKHKHGLKKIKPNYNQNQDNANAYKFINSLLNSNNDLERYLYFTRTLKELEELYQKIIELL